MNQREAEAAAREWLASPFELGAPPVSLTKIHHGRLGPSQRVWLFEYAPKAGEASVVFVSDPWVWSFHLPLEVFASVPKKNRNKRICNLSWAQILWLSHRDTPTRTSPEVVLERLPRSLKRRALSWPGDPEYVDGVMIDDVEYHLLKTQHLHGRGRPGETWFVGVTLDPTRGKSFPAKISNLADFRDKRALYRTLPFQHYLGGLLGPYEFEGYHRWSDAANG